MDSTPPPRTPLMWRFMLLLARLVVLPLCRLRVSGTVPADLRGRPLILAANHVSPFDPIVMTAACHKAGIAPRIMATGGLFDAPIAGPAMRAAGHIRVDRNTTRVADALPAATQALRDGAMVLLYPEGRIGLDPWMWPERGKTGVARMAAAAGAPVLPVAQWGAHAVLPYTTPEHLLRSLLHAIRRRPVVHVRFGDTPIDLSGVTGTPGAQAMQATRLIMDGIHDTLAALRPTEMQTPHHVDTTRPPDPSRIRPRRPAHPDKAPPEQANAGPAHPGQAHSEETHPGPAAHLGPVHPGPADIGPADTGQADTGQAHPERANTDNADTEKAQP
ncbi:1-acyl-sn-glycerol-3-phosphate acyltransferase [Actinoplanes sp. NPDC048988]|uniref:lysophospholipid acyltransferase family protein n=1 Tax=Actinoplanes sp. NPDC048988 TaxID=3363901 RepID=UPI00371D366D